MKGSIEEYLIQRFLKNNVRKYHKYCVEWINNLTENQVKYFILEKERL